MKKIAQSAPRPPRAFTLIELLTVIAIIGVLAAILIPTVGAVRRNAATAKDTGNLRQIGTALQLHVTENRGLLPSRGYRILGMDASIDPNSADWNMQEAADRYLNDRWKGNANSFYRHRGNDIWYSPFAETYAGFAASTANNQTQPIAYGYNPMVNDSRWSGRTSVVPNPSRTVIMGEVNNTQAMSILSAPITVPDQQATYRVNRNGRALYLFLDGRVALLAGDQSHTALIAAGQQSIWRWW